MTEFRYDVVATYDVTRDRFSLSGSYTDGASVYSVGQNKNYFAELDSGLCDYLSWKYRASSLFCNNNTTTGDLTVTCDDGTVHELVYTFSGHSHQLSQISDSSNYQSAKVNGSSLRRQLVTYLHDVHGYNGPFTCNLSNMRTITHVCQPRSCGGTAVVTIPGKNTGPVDNKPAPPAPVKPAEEPVDIGGGLSNMFGGGDDGDY